MSETSRFIVTCGFVIAGLIFAVGVFLGAAVF
jgi:hypothetical protein